MNGNPPPPRPAIAYIHQAVSGAGFRLSRSHAEIDEPPRPKAPRDSCAPSRATCPWRLGALAVFFSLPTRKCDSPAPRPRPRCRASAFTPEPFEHRKRLSGASSSPGSSKVSPGARDRVDRQQQFLPQGSGEIVAGCGRSLPAPRHRRKPAHESTLSAWRCKPGDS